MNLLLATLRRRRGPLVGTFVALSVAAILVSITACLVGTGLAGTVGPQRLVAATVVVTGSQDVRVTSGRGDNAQTDTVALPAYRRVPAGLARRLASLRVVSTAVADVSFPVALPRSGGSTAASRTISVTGHGWQSAALTPFFLESGHPPVIAHDIVLGAGVARAAGLKPGDATRLAGQETPPFTVVGIAATRPAGTAGDRAVFFADSEAAALYGHPGQADLVGVVGAAGTPASVVAAAVRASAGPGVTVLTGSDRGRAEDLTVATDKTNLLALGTGIAIDVVLIALFVVAGTVALSVGQRRRTFALLRAVGATPGQVRRSIIGELLVLGVLAGAVAYLPGTWLASLAVRGMASHQLLPATMRAWTGPVVLPIAAGAGVVVAELAGLVAGRRAGRVNPAEALQEASVERRWPHPVRVVLGLGALGGGSALCVLTLSQSANPDQQLNLALLLLLAFLAAVALLAPVLVAAAELVLRLPLRALSRVGARLGLADARVRPRRIASAVATIALAVAFTGAVYFVDLGVGHVSVAQGRQRLLAAEVVTAPDPGLAPSAVAAVAAQPGVAGAVGLTPTTVIVPDAGNELAAGEAITPGSSPAGLLTTVLDLKVISGSLNRFGPGDIALSQAIAGSGDIGTRVGQTITTYLADGTAYRARVSAIYFRSLGFADVLVPASAAGGGHLGSGAVGQVLVRGTESGAGMAAALGPRLAALAARYSGLSVTSRDVLNARAQQLTAQNSYANNLILATIGLLAAIALLNTLVMSTIEGHQSLRLLRRVGATTRQILSMTAWQTVFVSAIGLTFGAGAGAATLVAVTKALSGSWIPYLPWQPAFGIAGAVVVLTAIGTLAPTIALLRR